MTDIKQSMRLALGSSSGNQVPREANDFYASDPNNLVRFLPVMARDFTLADKVWEPFCGMGHLSEVLRATGREVRSTDLINYGYNHQDGTYDFFTQSLPFDGDILSNPPFKLAEESITHSLELIPEGRKVIMFLRIQFLEGMGRYNNLFRNGCLKYVYVYVTRANTAINGEFETYKKSAPAKCYAWFVFEKGYKGDAVLRWIP